MATGCRRDGKAAVHDFVGASAGAGRPWEDPAFGTLAAKVAVKICIVVPYDLAEEGGVKRNAVHVARSLREFGDEVTVVGPLSRGEPGPGVQGFGGSSTSLPTAPTTRWGS